MTTNPFSISIWVKTSDTSENYDQIIIRKDLESQSPRRIYGLTFQKWAGAGWGIAAGKAVFDAYDSGTFCRVDSTTSINDGIWHHVVGVREGTSFEIYLDGVLEASSTISASIDFGNDGNLYFGKYTETAGGYFNGTIDEARIYDRALSYGEIAWLAGRTEPFDKPF